LLRWRLDLVTKISLLVGVLAWPGALMAQDTGIELSYGVWWHDDLSFIYSATVQRPLWGPLEYGFGLEHVADRQSAPSRTLTGGVVSLGVGRRGGGPYVVGMVGLGVQHRNGDPDAMWGIGGGYAAEPFPFLALGVQGLYRLEDAGFHGFWGLDHEDRRGLALRGHVAFRFGGGPAPPQPPRGTPVPASSPPSWEAIASAARAGGTSDEAADVALAVVQTALDNMGAPYRWGGTDGNGFDCSGLIQYAYGEQGILVPRRSRDQARTGTLVENRVDQLRPGDVLGFAQSGSRVTHVGLYVGDGKFIHSSSTGVRLSSLTAEDPYSRWWQVRWVAARRILN